MRDDQVATKEDIQELRIALHAVEARLMRWMLGLFVPLWLGVAGMVAALLLRV